MAAGVRTAARAVRVAVVAGDAVWRRNLCERLLPVEDLRVVREADALAEAEVEAALGHELDVVVWQATPTADGAPLAQAPFARAWRARRRDRGDAAGAPALVVAAAQTDQGLARLCLELGARDLVGANAPLPEIAEAIYRAARVEARVLSPAATGRAAAARGLAVAVFSLRGGVGKTTLAIELAAALRRAVGRPVALMDMALATGSVGVALGLRPARPLGDLLAEAAGLDEETLGTYLTPHAPTGLSVLCAPDAPDVAEYVRQAHVTAIVAAARLAFAATVLDTSSALGEADFAAAQEADAVLLTLGPDLPSAAAARLALDLFDRFDISRGKVGLVLNRARPGGVGARDLERTLGVPVWAEIGEDPRALAAVNGATTVWHLARRGPLARGAELLAARLVGPRLETAREARVRVAPLGAGSGR
jgi:pilus assembly protein CpaE